MLFHMKKLALFKEGHSLLEVGRVEFERNYLFLKMNLNILPDEGTLNLEEGLHLHSGEPLLLMLDAGLFVEQEILVLRKAKQFSEKDRVFYLGNGLECQFEEIQGVSVFKTFSSE